MSAVVEMDGKTFGRLTVIRRDQSNDGRAYWLCRCACGNPKRVFGKNLRNGMVRSCGCLQIEIATKQLPHRIKHGHARDGCQTPEYRAWHSLIQRCTNPNIVGYKHYGGRGIRVCESWRNSFALFLLDMGEKPSPKHSIDRYPDNNGNYEPGNCRWATAKEQMDNRRPIRAIRDSKGRFVRWEVKI